MSGGWVVAIVTVVIIALSAFFVAIEFALIAAKRHRLEDAAATSRSARAALRSSSELTVMLAGSQLGITVCALALGAITKPAVHYWLTPMFEEWGWTLWVADAAGFALALLIVTFLHLVIGEMAPKSWAIAHPERSATMLAIPMRGYMWLTRPLLRGLNEAANWCLRRVGVEPSDQVGEGRDPGALRQLVEHSAETGSLEEGYSSQLALALDLETMTIRDLVAPGSPPTAVPLGSTVADVQDATLSSGHLRILVGDADAIEGVVHVRDTLTAPADGDLVALTRPVLHLEASTVVHAALATMRETRQHLVVVTEGDDPVGVVTLADILQRLFPVVR